MKYIKCNIEGRDIKFKLQITKYSNNNKYFLNILYKIKPFQIFSNTIELGYIWEDSLDYYRTISDKELIRIVKNSILKDINRRLQKKFIKFIQIK